MTLNKTKTKCFCVCVSMLVIVMQLWYIKKPIIILECERTLLKDHRNTPYLPIIYAITPTYTRLVQKADLTRLSQTLMLVKNLHWIVVEDSETKTKLVEKLLKESTLRYTHLNVKNSNPKDKIARGIDQRNLALDWLRGHLKKLKDKRGIVFFMDDDNTYSIKLFEEMRKIKKVGVWPVGFAGGLLVETALVTNSSVSGYNAVWKPSRPFPIDMAGFAINATLFLDRPDAKFSRTKKIGLQESQILQFFTKKEELEPLADNCTKVYVWHTRTQKPPMLNPAKIKYPIIPLDHIEARGVEQRNLGLDWFRDHLKKMEDKRGIVFFMDDDNTYSIKLFDEMRKIKKVGVWPVGFAGGMLVEAPLVTNSTVSGFNAVWKPHRLFPIDMAGFTINATLFLVLPDARFSRTKQIGFQESQILNFFTNIEDLEPLADNCKKVYVWHTQTRRPYIMNTI